MSVAGAEDEEVVVAGALGPGREGEPGAVGELHRVQPLEGNRSRLGRRPIGPDRPLAVGGRVVDPLDEVPGERPTIDRLAYAGRPVPAGAALLVAGRLVIDAES